LKRQKKEPINKTQFLPGDILCVNRGIYKHYGIYAGNSAVIHYAAGNGDFGSDVSVRKTTLEHFQKGCKCKVPKISRQMHRKHYSPEETLERAHSRLGEKNYNLLFNNCEHFILWCKTGKGQSRQVTNAFCTVALIGVGIIGASIVAQNEKGYSYD
jgi:hypothetical protein